MGAVRHLHVDGKSPATIAIVVAAVRWWLKNENNAIELPITTRTLAGVSAGKVKRGRGQVKGLDWQATERVCAFAESDKTISTLNEYGLEEGLRRLEADDIEMIKQLEQLVQRKRPTRRSRSKN